MSSITKDLADRINGIEYPADGIELYAEEAKEANLVIVFGLSDDIFKFCGAIDDELSGYNGAKAYIINGNPFRENDLEEDMETLRKYGFLEVAPSLGIRLIWQPEEVDASWLVEVEGAENSPFDVMEDGRLYCRGSVLMLPTA